MAVHLTDRKKIGCAYYVALEEKLYFMEDMQMGGVDVVESRWPAPLAERPTPLRGL